MQLDCLAFAHVRTFSGCRGFREHTHHVDIIRFVRPALHSLATPVPTKVARVVTETSAHAATVNTGGTDTLQKLHKQKWANRTTNKYENKTRHADSKCLLMGRDVATKTGTHSYLHKSGTD